MFDHLSPGKVDRRWELAHDLMREHGLDVLLVFGNSGINRHNEANIFWLTNPLDLHHVPFEPIVVPL